MQWSTIDIVAGNECWNVPDTARNIYAQGTYLAFAAEFEISERDFVDYCEKSGWELVDIAEPITIWTYRDFEAKTQGTHAATITNGKIYDGMSRGGGGIITAFDRNRGMGFLDFSHH